MCSIFEMFNFNNNVINRDIEDIIKIIMFHKTLLEQKNTKLLSKMLRFCRGAGNDCLNLNFRQNFP